MAPTNFIDELFRRMINFYEAYVDIMLLPIDYIMEKIKNNKDKNIKL